MEIHYAMPLRNMLMDALSYIKQVQDIARHNEQNNITLEGSNKENIMKLHKRFMALVVASTTLASSVAVYATAAYTQNVMETGEGDVTVGTSATATRAEIATIIDRVLELN
ncbi:MAG: hypothetical protein BEN19_06475 [Epulopiscium sp. Nuni2H_MBin003]|nr:MAG: hypothetical protein BEN19_06475 [Epulopiscium sp. Nuni2H_MBin003]